MFGLTPKLPIYSEERIWVDQGFERLEKLLGMNRLVQTRVVLPTPDDSPDPYDGSPAAAERLFARVCAYMQVDRNQIQLEFIQDQTEELRSLLPQWSGQSAGCAGFFVHKQDKIATDKAKRRMLIAVQSSHLKDPLSLVAVMAHELGHAILLGGGLLDPETEDQEPLTDLLTVFLGFGVFNANAAGRFKQWQDDRRFGWSMQRLGYLSEEIYGYALALFAHKRDELKPLWEKHLSTNVRNHYKRARSWIVENAASEPSASFVPPTAT